MTGISSHRWWTKKIARSGVSLAGALGVPWLSYSEPRAYALNIVIVPGKYGYIAEMEPGGYISDLIYKFASGNVFFPASDI